MGMSSKDISRLSSKARAKIANPRNKYGAKKTEFLMADGNRRRFDSEKEANRFCELSLRERAGDIKDLRCQVEYILIPKQVRPDGKKEQPVKYFADFAYIEKGQVIVEDVKGYRNPSDPAYRLFTVKRKLMLYIHGITVREV